MYKRGYIDFGLPWQVGRHLTVLLADIYIPGDIYITDSCIFKGSVLLADTFQEMFHYNRYMHLRGISSASRYIPGDVSL